MGPSDRVGSRGSRSQSGSGLKGVAAALLDADGRIVWWSRSARRLLGWAGAEAVGRSAGALLGSRRPSWLIP
ncbi:PAS domain-containing protein [Streptomyces diastatochromogenes]|nr:PAS domain-containing protein [Streptomyces diastatochromogenes]